MIDFVTKQKFTEAAREIKFLKRNLARQEKRRIQLHKLIPSSGLACIYGLATGDCGSKRAVQLILKLKVPTFYDLNAGYQNEPTEYVINELKKSLKWMKGQSNPEPASRHLAYTAMEWLIHAHPYNNRRVINFIKGKCKTLKLKSRLNDPLEKF